MRRVSIGVRYLTIIAAIFVSAACGNPGATVSHGSITEGDPGGSDMHELLRNPLGNLGEDVAAADQAKLPFVPYEPEAGLGPAERIVAYADSKSPSASEIAWVYDSSEYGSFVVLEYLDSWTEEQMATEASPVPSPGCRTNAVVVDQDGVKHTLKGCSYNNFITVSLPGGHQGLLGGDGDASSISWAEALITSSSPPPSDLEALNVVLEIFGPADTFSTSQAVRAATAMRTSIDTD